MPRPAMMLSLQLFEEEKKNKLYLILLFIFKYRICNIDLSLKNIYADILIYTLTQIYQYTYLYGVPKLPDGEVPCGRHYDEYSHD